MGQYLVLLYGDESAAAAMDDATRERVHAGHTAFGEKHRPTLLGGNALQPTSTATTVSPDDTGSFSITDGPFAEVKEALAGYYLIEVADLDQAIALAKDVPMPFGRVEIRPIRVLS